MSRTPEKKRGRPRVREVGSVTTYLSLDPAVRAEVERIAAKEQRSVAQMLRILVAEAVKART
jgi:hypothetical protein